MKRILRLFAIAIVAIASLASCGGSDEPTSMDPTPTPEPTPVPEPVTPDYFAIDAMDDGTAVTFAKVPSTYPQTIPDPKLLYSLDGETWQDVTIDAPIMLNKDQKVMYKAAEGGNKRFYEPSAVGFSFKTQDASHRINVSGNIMYLLDGENPATAMTSENAWVFSYFFRNCEGLVSAKNLKLPATTLAESCYYNMFHRCSSLIEAPELPATTMAEYCYYGMFYSCNNLKKAPALPATKLAESCYTNMFGYCSSLTEAPELPATTLEEKCYDYMFQSCTSLTKAPELPATTLARRCYDSMFKSCTSLTKAPELPATTLEQNCYYSMFEECNALTETPLLPAKTLVYECYKEMFKDCSNLTTVKIQFTEWNDSKYATEDWLEGVAANGTILILGSELSDLSTRNASRLPVGWSYRRIM